ncbi:flagellar protein FliS [Acetomicrobium thermoterrenum DSM 13490]|jgi:flagellar protein FliS|uniref:Flagellar protein FliS n=2 Tax=Acetomicrobium TaxID=49894 RepID=A0A0T5XE38_9BACT|nr:MULTISPECIES: flagellar export chaperone FliS [Acetomicrobium]KRT35989.1 flagellar protein FliS [Acetomicrobium hydrogeniformans ATCC BAA-1850]SDX68157.1 flagellar protein FliS [Acetomicrobium thermoterrenum DSM 13490]
MLPSGNEAQITYRVNQIQTASREQLLLITYDIGIGAIKVAKEALRDGNNEVANRELQRAQAVIRELMSALDVSAGEWATALMSLYEFMYEQLVKANVEKDPNIMDSVRSMLEELRALWQEAMEKSRVESLAQGEARRGEVRPQGGLDFAG